MVCGALLALVIASMLVRFIHQRHDSERQPRRYLIHIIILKLQRWKGSCGSLWAAPVKEAWSAMYFLESGPLLTSVHSSNTLVRFPHAAE